MLLFSPSPHPPIYNQSNQIKESYTYYSIPMAVEARYLNLSPPQMLFNREAMLNGFEATNNNLYGSGMIFGLPTSTPLNETVRTTPVLYGMAGMDSLPPIKADSGLTYAHLPVVSRKRSREDSNNSININQLLSYPSGLQNPNISALNNHSSAQFTFLGQDFSSQIHRQQLEVDSFIAQHTEKVRLEIEERRKRYSTRIMAAVEERMMKKLKAKDDEFQKIVKLNWALEEKVKSLIVENRIWRDLAQSNEATANVLRNNLEQVVAQVEYEHHQNNQGAAELVDDAESSCGGNSNEPVENTITCRQDTAGDRLCRSCGKDEACVLLLPCRHLCLCSVCGSSQNVCPICKSAKNCSLHVNLSS